MKTFSSSSLFIAAFILFGVMQSHAQAHLTPAKIKRLQVERFQKMKADHYYLDSVEFDFGNTFLDFRNIKNVFIAEFKEAGERPNSTAIYINRVHKNSIITVRKLVDSLKSTYLCNGYKNPLLVSIDGLPISDPEHFQIELSGIQRISLMIRNDIPGYYPDITSPVLLISTNYYIK